MASQRPRLRLALRSAALFLLPRPCSCSRELSKALWPPRGAATSTPDTYLADAAYTACAALDPYPAAVFLPIAPTVLEAMTACSSLALCGGFIYTTAAARSAAGGLAYPDVVVCKTGTFVAGSASPISGIAYSRYEYGSCDLRVSLATTTASYYGDLAGTRSVCVRIGRGTSSRDRTPTPNVARKYKPPKPMTTSGGVRYDVDVDVFLDAASAQADSDDGTSHTMISDTAATYHMYGPLHSTRGESVKAVARDGYYPVYPTETAARAASTRGGGAGLATAVGAAAGASPARWSEEPHSQIYYMPTDGATLYTGDYVAPFSLDGYYPLYRSMADAAKASSDGSVHSHGPGSDSGNPQRWTTGEFKFFYMPGLGSQQYHGDYAGDAPATYATVLYPDRTGGEGSAIAAAAAAAHVAAMAAISPLPYGMR